MKKLRPFVKWAGGKTQLLPAIRERMPKSYRRYIEPFLGGGALLLATRPCDAIASDSNPVLIQAYADIQEHPETVMEKTRHLDHMLQEKQTREDQNACYQAIRARFNACLGKGSLNTTSTALFLFLNKHCFNGLYRMNQRGEFNAPFAYTARDSFTEEEILAVSGFLQETKVQLSCCDFGDTCRKAREGDFVFIDSPYAPIGEAKNFVSYTKAGFTEADHRRLAETVRNMAHRGAMVLVTNHDTPLIRKLYEGFPIEKVRVHRNISCDGRNRYGEEVLITTYQHP